jgi:hypothetical protein
MGDLGIDSQRDSVGSRHSSNSPIKSRERPAYSIEVKNLPDRINDKDFFKYFRDEGFRLKAAKLDPEDKSFGKLDFFNGIEAERCIK